MITLNYTAWLGQKLGQTVENIILPDEATTLEDLYSFLKNRSPAYFEIFSNINVIYAEIEGSVVEKDCNISRVNNITLFTPIVGG